MALYVLEVVLVGWAVHAGLLHRQVERARRDPLTGLLTRVGWTRRARRAVRDRSGAAVLLIDLDGFKTVNDTCGHQVGDLVLTTTGRRLIDWCRPGEPAGRLGGDEFVAVVTGPDVEKRVSRLRTVLSDPVPGASVGVSASIGYARTTGERGADLTALMEGADRAMYATKRARRSAQPYLLGSQSFPPSSATATGRRSLRRDTDTRADKLAPIRTRILRSCLPPRWPRPHQLMEFTLRPSQKR